jgi:hypothetical protein
MAFLPNPAIRGYTGIAESCPLNEWSAFAKINAPMRIGWLGFDDFEMPRWVAITTSCCKGDGRQTLYR